MANYFGREAEIIDIVYGLIRISLEYLHLIGTLTKLSCLNKKLLSSLSLYLYFRTKHTRQY